MKAVFLNDILPFGQFFGNDSDHNFAKLGDDYLSAAEILLKHNGPDWPTYANAFQALENYLKSYLLKKGRTPDYIKNEIGHKLQVALEECQKLGLDLSDGDAQFIEKIMGFSRAYTSKDFQYRRVGGWEVFLPGDVIFFVGKVRDAVQK
jgi:HEPN domain-containing protein